MFQYLDDDGVRQAISSGDVNDYLREISGQGFTAKDFRTWSGTKLAVSALTELGDCASQTQIKKNILRTIDSVADQLNNTRAVCRKYYVHPSVFEVYAAGTMLEVLQSGTISSAKTQLEADEAAVVWLLQQQLKVDKAS